MATIHQEVDAFEEIVEFVLSSPTLEQIASIRPSEELDARITYLQEANSSGRITLEELEELDEFLVLEHLMRLLKIRATGRLKTQQ